MVVVTQLLAFSCSAFHGRHFSSAASFSNSAPIFSTSSASSASSIGLGASSVSSSDGNTVMSFVHHREYPNDDFSHILGYGNADHTPSKLQQISALRIEEVIRHKTPIDTVSHS